MKAKRPRAGPAVRHEPAARKRAFHSTWGPRRNAREKVFDQVIELKGSKVDFRRDQEEGRR